MFHTQVKLTLIFIALWLIITSAREKMNGIFLLNHIVELYCKQCAAEGQI